MDKAVIKAITQIGRNAINKALKENLKENLVKRTITKGVWRFDTISEDPLVIEAVLNPKYKTFVHNDTVKENFILALQMNGAKYKDDFTVEVL